MTDNVSHETSAICTTAGCGHVRYRHGFSAGHVGCFEIIDGDYCNCPEFRPGPG